MKQEEKQLLLQDLCARLPYKLFAQWHHKVLNEFRDVKIMKISTYGKNIDAYHINVLCQPEPGVDYEASIVDIKPYLRPMSSMTEEERKECESTFDSVYDVDDYGEDADSWHKEFSIRSFDWLNANYFDYRGLIEKNLALDCTGLHIYD